MGDRLPEVTKVEWPRDRRGVVLLDGVAYRDPGIVEIRYTHGSVMMEFPGEEIVNPCSACGRFDTRPRIAYGWRDAIERGWLVPAP